MLQRPESITISYTRFSCKGYSEANRRGAFVKAANAALVLLQSLSIGNSRAAFKSNSEEVVFFLSQNRTTEDSSGTQKAKQYERMPDVTCVSRKNLMDVKDLVDMEHLLEAASSQPCPNRCLEWKHHHSCWEFMRSLRTLEMIRPDHSHSGYPAAPLKEYSDTEKYNTFVLDEDSQFDWNITWDAAGKIFVHNRLMFFIGYSFYFDKAARPLSNQTNMRSDSPNIVTYSSIDQRCPEDAVKVFYDTFGRDHIMNVAINGK